MKRGVRHGVSDEFRGVGVEVEVVLPHLALRSLQLAVEALPRLRVQGVLLEPREHPPVGPVPALQVVNAAVAPRRLQIVVPHA